MYDKKSKVIVIPEGTKSINYQEFKDFKNVEEIILPSSLLAINASAFEGCTSLKKINLPESLCILENEAFKDCTSLEEITLGKNISYLSEGVFQNCKSLKRLNILGKISYIDDFALENCENLEGFDIPESATSLGELSLKGCKKIKVIHIPEKMEHIGVGALSYMDSLSQIIVDEKNDKYLSDEDIVLLSKDGAIIQYAINCGMDNFLCGYYEVKNYYRDADGNITGYYTDYQIPYNILDYAFAGAKKLKVIDFPSEIDSIGAKSFDGCDNLKQLNIFHSTFGDSVNLSVRKSYKEEVIIPFEKIIIEDGIVNLCENLEEIFKSAKEVSLPSTLEHIGRSNFTKSKDLKEITIPFNVKTINPETFHSGITLHFADIEDIKSDDFVMLQTKTNEEIYLRNRKKDNVRIFNLKDGTYYVRVDKNDTVRVHRDEIDRLSSTSKEVKKPEDFIIYLTDLLDLNFEVGKIISGICSSKELTSLFEKFRNDANYVKEIGEYKTAQAIREVIEDSDINDEFLFSSLIMRKFDKNDIKKILENYNNSISRFFRYGTINEENEINADNLIYYCDLLEKYNQNDRFLYNTVFFQSLSRVNQEILIKNFNKNIKLLLKSSMTLNDSYGNNLSDLIKLCEALGIFSDDKVLSQKLTTFLNEKIFSQTTSLGEKNEYYTVGDNIHTIFGEIDPREEVDYEFILFFIENYKELLKIEKEKSGIIARIYNSFREISKTSTSHKGSQRHLKVTTEKCINYFLSQKFEGVTKKNRKLAEFLQTYYSEPFVLNAAEMIVDQSKKAPRNIFTRVSYDENHNPIYSHKKSEDLREYQKEFSFHWLPKQDFNNLVLGKQCSCCAHILGAGAGIMRASMILDNCQNLVIRNSNDDIIAKMTLYVNKEKGYAVFNTTELNNLYSSEENKEKIYEAFLRGIESFVKEYNRNNIIPIKKVNIGEYRNVLTKYLGNEEELLKTPNYSAYGYYLDNSFYGTYDGDDKRKQLLVIKK